jgi:predicted transcriptional regulator
MDDIVGYLKKSRRRIQVLKALGRSITTSNKVAAQTKLQVRTVRPIIYDLVKKGLVKKAVDKPRRPMIYQTTSLGEAALRMTDAFGNIRWKGTSRQKSIARRVKSRL